MSTTPDTMTRYVVLIYEQQSPDWPADMPPEVMQASEEFDGWIAEQGGRTIAGLALESSATATSIRGDVVTDGPFIETKEQLGGVVMLDVPDLDEAIKWAERLPWTGPVEIRPVMDYEAYAQQAGVSAADYESYAQRSNASAEGAAS
jgi:hypothetical protein